MLVSNLSTNEHHVVMGVIFDKAEHRQLFIYSTYGNHNGQYAHPADNHAVIDSTIPENWEFGYDEYNQWQIMSFPEWVRNTGRPGKPGFYEQYIDGDDQAVETFRSRFVTEKQKYINDPHLAEDSQDFS